MSTSTRMVRACALIDSADRVIFPSNTPEGELVERISAGTPAWVNSPAELCGTSTNTRNGSVCAMRYNGVVVVALPAVTRLPMSILRSVIVPSNGATTCLNCVRALDWSDLDLSDAPWALAAYRRALYLS